MQTNEELKSLVREKYDQIARQSKDENAASCCGAGECSQEVYNIMTDDYGNVEGYQEIADLGLGCGLPTEFAQIKTGDTVLDLGSGAGNDCFIARHETGPTGKVLGVDFTPSMIEKARINADKLGLNNVEFREGDIEDLPVADESVDVVISNCVLNLVPNKKGVLDQIKRVLKAGGHFSISDIVLEGELPEALQKDAEMYAGCVSGAIQMSDYLNMIRKTGFSDITIQKKKVINIPDDILQSYLNEAEITDFKSGKTGIFSISVFARKPSDCVKGSGCC